jgi:NDP-sugar pyrophosphorylase family protein
MIAIILCGGAATRYGGNKVLTVFKKKSLLEWNIRFCLENDIRDIRITTNAKFGEDIKREIQKMFTSLHADKLISDENTLKIEISLQPEDKYGTAAALIPWVGRVDDDFVVLFGDNYYDGKIDFELSVSDCAATYKTFTKSKENLRLSYVEDDNTIIEKPHLYDEGNFFVGFMLFKKDMIDKVNELQPSRRGEFEITELFNLGTYRSVYPLNMHWFDITSREELEYV